MISGHDLIVKHNRALCDTLLKTAKTGNRSDSLDSDAVTSTTVVF